MNTFENEPWEPVALFGKFTVKIHHETEQVSNNVPRFDTLNFRKSYFSIRDRENRNFITAYINIYVHKCKSGSMCVGDDTSFVVIPCSSFWIDINVGNYRLEIHDTERKKFQQQESFERISHDWTVKSIRIFWYMKTECILSSSRSLFCWYIGRESLVGSKNHRERERGCIVKHRISRSHSLL